MAQKNSAGVGLCTLVSAGFFLFESAYSEKFAVSIGKYRGIVLDILGYCLQC